jgi:hypothetical protein
MANPGLLEVAELGLSALSTASALEPISVGKLTITRQQGDRMRNPPKPKDGTYEATVLNVSLDDPVLPNLSAVIKVHWTGNAYGEIGGAYIQVDPDHTEFEMSSLQLDFSLLNDLPNQGDDPRAWPMQWIYNGRFDPVGNGDFEIQGKFQINAFGGFKVLEHTVTDRSLLSFSDPYSIIAAGSDIDAPIPPLPDDAIVNSSGSP